MPADIVARGLAVAAKKRNISFFVNSPSVQASLISFVVPFGMTIRYVNLTVDTAPQGAALIIDILLNGSTVFVTAPKPQIAAAATSGQSGTPDLTALAAQDKVSLSILQVGSTTTGANLSVGVVCQQD